MELPSDARLLKIMFNVRAYYPKLVKKFVVKNDDIALGLLNFSCKLFVRKDVLDISPLNVPVINEYSLQLKAICYCITSFLYHVGTHVALECEECCLCQFVKHTKSHEIQPPIGVLSVICGI